MEPMTPCACPSGGGRFEGDQEGAGLPDEGITHTPRRGYTQTPLPSSEREKGQTNGGSLSLSMLLGNC